jgi:hypothetical protein
VQWGSALCQMVHCSPPAICSVDDPQLSSAWCQNLCGLAMWWATQLLPSSPRSEHYIAYRSACKARTTIRLAGPCRRPGVCRRRGCAGAAGDCNQCRRGTAQHEELCAGLLPHAPGAGGEQGGRGRLPPFLMFLSCELNCMKEREKGKQSPCVELGQGGPCVRRARALQGW